MGTVFMKTLQSTLLSLLMISVVWPGAVRAQTKLKVAYPTTVGSMAVIWVAKEARLFEKHGLDVELIVTAQVDSRQDSQDQQDFHGAVGSRMTCAAGNR